MYRTRMFALLLTALAAGSLATASPAPRRLAPGDKAPDAVEATFQSRFPGAEVHFIDVEEEFGVMVYDFEFKHGELEKETDISADGTLLDSTLVIDPEVVPAAAMKTIRATAKGGRLGRTERIEIGFELDEGKVVALPAPVTNYACEMTRGGKKAEVIVDPQGAIVEAPKWVSAAAPKAKPAVKTTK